jgi:tRNA pseudouridine55 synthase
VDGVLLVDKPAGPTSHDVVALVRRALGTRRVGHAGTLDPFATGLLVCCVGRATRLVPWLTGCDKRYEGLVRFGWSTTTGDGTGAPLAEPVAAHVGAEALARAAGSFPGQRRQVPPMFSAKKIDGVALHVLARRGEVVERDAVTVRIARFAATLVAPDAARIEVTCSAGTYVRVLAEELGAAVGVPAHLETLRRTGSGAFDADDAIASDALSPVVAAARLVPIASVPLPRAGGGRGVARGAAVGGVCF